MERQFTSTDVIQLARITPRQLQWWNEHRLLDCAMNGHRRIFQARDILRAMVIQDLKTRGVGRSRVRRLSRSVDRMVDQSLQTTGRRFLASDGRVLRLVEADEVLRSLREWPGGVFLIPISEFIDRMETYEPGKRRRSLVNVRRVVHGGVSKTIREMEARIRELESRLGAQPSKKGDLR